MHSSREDYLQVIYRLTKKNGFATNKAISVRLQISRPSVTEMLRKLKNEDLVLINKTRITLSERGVEEAQRLLSKHRIWEYFLSEKLGFKEPLLHQQADLLEHATMDELLEALNKYLDYPVISPKGNIIYTNQDKQDKSES